MRRRRRARRTEARHPGEVVDGPAHAAARRGSAGSPRQSCARGCQRPGVLATRTAAARHGPRTATMAVAAGVLPIGTLVR